VRNEEVRALGSEELAKKLQEARLALFNLRMRVATRQLEDSSAVNKARREVARLLTAKRERELVG